MLLIYHFFSVAIYSIYILFTTPSYRPSSASSTGSISTTATSSSASVSLDSESESDEVESIKGGDVLLPPSFTEYPALTVKSAKVFWTALVVLAPVLWNEGQM